MKRAGCILAGALSGAPLLLALACATAAAVERPPIRVILVGDSTMATRSGYGDALCARLKPEVVCVNLARGGRSSGSFRAEGRWDEVMRLLRDGTRDGTKSGPTYVLVQFGHNDQPGKPGRSTDLVTGFPANMERYARETREAGGIPVLVTPLARRSFRGAWLHNDLAPWAEATRRAARRTQAALLDLNADSVAAVQALGQQEADLLAMAPPPETAPGASPDANKAEAQGAAKTAFDRTHLGPKGAALFAAMVEREMARALPATRPWFRDGGRP